MLDISGHLLVWSKFFFFFPGTTWLLQYDTKDLPCTYSYNVVTCDLPIWGHEWVTCFQSTEPAVLDNFVKSLFSPTVAVTASFWTRRTQEVTSSPNTPPPHYLLWGEERVLYCPFQKQEGTRSFLPAQGLARGRGLWLHHIWSMGPNLLVPSCQLPVFSP